MEYPRGPVPPPAAGVAPSVLYGITAVRMEGSQVTEVMMGMIDPSLEQWDLRPAPTRWWRWWTAWSRATPSSRCSLTERGTLQMGPEVKVDVLPEGTETLFAGRGRCAGLAAGTDSATRF